MKILLIDDHRLVADAMAIMLQDLDQAVDVTVCHSTQRALSLIDEQQHFDLILTDMFMPGIDGLGLLHGLRSRKIEAPAVVVSSTEDKKIVRAAIDQGAAGFIRKSLPGAEMLRALKSIVAGQPYYPDEFAPALRRRSSGADPAILPEEVGEEETVMLGERQAEVLELMAAGNSNKQIAQLLGISEATV
ncbi:MAG: response regulator transcription factor, partial [Gammaproteobacteria bacterium]|nr:response regulator transcription factor [Gammaproteobacteria bacterium]